MAANEDDVEAQCPPPSDQPTEKSADDDEKEKNPPDPLATIKETFSFGSNSKRKVPCLVIGLFCATVTGCVYPAMAFFFAKVFEELGADSSSPDFMENIQTMAFTFMILGAMALVTMTVQNTLLEIVAGDMTMSLKTSWFDALLRQDMAYYDIKDVSGTATMVSAKALRYRRGIGRKLGEGVQFTLTMLGGFAYAFYASWRTSLVVLAVLPVMVASGAFMLKVTQGQTARSNAGYAEAGSIAYAAVSAIKTVLSLNACRTMIEKYNAATEKAYRAAAGYMPIVGCATGAGMASFIVSYVLLTLYGAFLLYSAVRSTGCDPSGIVATHQTCAVTAMDVFGALMGMSFGAMGLPQISAAIEAFQGARAACYPAVVAMNRSVGRDAEESNSDETKKRKGAARRDSTPLPQYAIDSSSPDGRKPSDMRANIEFRNVSFTYPTRAETLVFDGFSLDIEAGKTIALVGPSGSGKSTVVQLVERFYDPTAGSISIDGIDLRELNVKWLREQIGLVSQEPVLFARSIKENVAYGCPTATQEQIEHACKLANAHDFITSFPDGYRTEVGDKGAQLSGGQKQRVAIARVLLKNPKILLLDEATSALDSESERVVQRALDSLLESSNRTTIVIAHRLSTIRNADMIAVVADGKIVETGTHDELMAVETSKYRQLVEAQSGRRVSEVPAKRHSSIMDANNEDTISRNELPQLKFHDVTFSYPTRRENVVFRGLNLSVRKGETLALVGSSGGGKSTVVQLIERFYDPDSGAIELEGTDLRELNVEWLRDQLGLVGQEPTLFNTTIAENIKYGFPSATKEQIEEAAKEANAHDFIMSFPDGYDTNVGERGTQVSGGQKQRIAIARAIIKRPKVLMLDEATSALDSESEQIVQEAMDKIMAAKSQTIIVIAHRLSTIRNADRIAVIADGKVREIGTHDELMARPNGRYRRLQEHQCLDGSIDETVGSSGKSNVHHQTEKEFQDEEEDVQDKDDDSIVGDEMAKKSSKRARALAKDDICFFFVGSIGAVLAGLVFPSWGIIFAYMIELLYHPIFPCDEEVLAVYGTCDDYYQSEADEMQQLSYRVTYGWLGVIGATMIGNILLMYGFGTASERMNKRVRDAAFQSLVRQEPAFFDKRSIGMITSQLEDDAAMIHSFSGEPIRTLVMNVSSVLVGLVVSFYYMWPFALLTLATLPFMGFGAEVEMRMYMGEDHVETKEDENSPGGILVETLLNIRTVASLTIEERRSKEYKTALKGEDPAPIKTNLIKGSTTGLGFFIQMWGMALLFWWGGWLLAKYPDAFTYTDYLISMFALLFSLSGMAVAAQGATNREKAKIAANRIFYLVDRESQIDPLGDDGKKVA